MDRQPGCFPHVAVTPDDSSSTLFVHPGRMVRMKGNGAGGRKALDLST